jgi:hypothetical protein
MLAKRLAKHGLAMTGAALGTALSEQAASAGVPIAVASSTITAASILATGQAAAAGAISAEVADLTERMIKGMLLTKLRIPLVLVVALAVMVIGVGHRFLATQAAGASGTVQPPPEVSG